MKKRQNSLLLLALGVLVWLAGGLLILLSDVLAVQIVGLALFAIGPTLVFVAGRMLRPKG